MYLHLILYIESMNCTRVQCITGTMQTGSVDGYHVILCHRRQHFRFSSRLAYSHSPDLARLTPWKLTLSKGKKDSAPSSHVWLTFYSFPIRLNADHA